MYKIIRINNDPLGTICRLGDGASIPFDPDNTDYQEYLEWLAEGNEPLPPDSQE
jgi:hypothetical protein